jgi:hypothetical protein
MICENAVSTRVETIEIGIKIPRDVDRMTSFSDSELVDAIERVNTGGTPRAARVPTRVAIRVASDT